jgi:hypothetical protein
MFCSVVTFKINDLMAASQTLSMVEWRYAPVAIGAVPLVGMSVPMSLPQTPSGYGLYSSPVDWADGRPDIEMSSNASSEAPAH